MTITPAVPLTPCACARPAIATMDYVKRTGDQWEHQEPRINRCCTQCWAHWFGPPEAVTYFTKAQWHAEMADVFGQEGTP